MKTLAELVQALPIEVYNAILDLTFTADSAEYQIDGSYHPPSCLQVSRSTRKTFACSYYGNSSFLIQMPTRVENRSDLIKSASFDKLRKWTGSLPESHYRFLKDVRLVRQQINTIQEDFPAIFTALLAVEECVHPPSRYNVVDSLKFEVVRPGVTEKKWMSFHEVFKECRA